MASSSKPTGVHYALITFVLISIVCGLGWLLAYKGSNSISDMRRDLTAAKENADKQSKLASGYYDDIKKLMELTGAKYDSVGDGSNPNTVAGDMLLHIKNYGHALGVVEPTYNGVIVKMSEHLRATMKERDQLKEQLAVELAQFQQKIDEMNAAVSTEKNSREQADKGKVDADNTHKEEQKVKDNDIAELKKEYAALRQEYDDYRDSAEKKEKDQGQRISSLQTINKKLAGELDEKTRPSFEIPDGVIRWIDPVGKKVWISLGEADGLKPRTTFSVYKKTHSGVGRGTVKGAIGGEDIKGSIEVTRVLEANLSEARILHEDLYSPMAKGDPIYSPLWSPGRGEAFSIVGIIDLDGDGKDDRDLFREAVTTAGATIDNDITPQGKLLLNGREPDPYKPQISEKTKFVVIGKIPEVSDTADPDEIATIIKINGLKKDLVEAANERGVRVVSLSDFLSYIGYKPQRRLFVPGSDVPYNLKSGSASAAVGESLGASRKSSGATSGAYSSDKSQKPKNTSNIKGQVFRGGYGK